MICMYNYSGSDFGDKFIGMLVAKHNVRQPTQAQLHEGWIPRNTVYWAGSGAFLQVCRKEGSRDFFSALDGSCESVKCLDGSREFVKFLNGSRESVKCPVKAAGKLDL